MNVYNLIDKIEKVDPEVYDRLDSRRKVMQRFSFIGKTLALAAVPSALGTMFKKAYGQSTTTIAGVLQFALLLENLEAEFYKRVVSIAPAIGVPSGAPLAALTTIRDHEVAHVNFLRAALTSLGTTPTNYTAASFDFSAGNGSQTGPFAAYASNYGVMLAVAQTFEDTGVRAYKGQAGNLISNNDVLTAALQIHSVEARHAAHIRYMRSNLSTGSLVPSGTTVRPWITQAQSGIDTGNGGANAAIQASYAGEDTATQAGVAITNVGGASVSANKATESFDEPLTAAQVTAIVDPFIV